MTTRKPGGSQSNIVIATDHLGRNVNGRAIVDDVTVEVRSGEVLAVVGPSGSGKTSFLRLLNRLDEPTSGTVLFEGTDYRQIPPTELRRKVGMVTQRAYLFPGTVEENLGFGPRQRGESLTKERSEELLSRVGLPGYGASEVANLSGGEAQRVSIARALANAPVVLLLDEPTSALDEESKAGVEDLIQDIINDSGLTCVMVTHDNMQAARMAGRVLMMRAGRAVALGSVEQVLRTKRSFSEG